MKLALHPCNNLTMATAKWIEVRAKLQALGIFFEFYKWQIRKDQDLILDLIQREIDTVNEQHDALQTDLGNTWAQALEENFGDEVECR